MRRKVLPIIVLALATAGYSKHGPGEFKNPSTIYANPNHLSSWEQAYGNADDLEDRLTKLYGADAAKYGLQVVDNGTRIRKSPDKQRYLYDTIERRLRDKWSEPH